MDRDSISQEISAHIRLEGNKIRKMVEEQNLMAAAPRPVTTQRKLVIAPVIIKVLTLPRELPDKIVYRDGDGSIDEVPCTTESFSVRLQALILESLVEYGDSFTHAVMLEYFFSVVNISIPNFVTTFFLNLKTIAFREIPMNATDANIIATAEWEEGTFLTHLNFESKLKKPWTHDIIMAIMGSLYFALGKAPNRMNVTAFTVNRIRAFFGTIGREMPDLSNMTPRLEIYQLINGSFNIYTELRARLVAEMVNEMHQPTQCLMMTSFNLITPLWGSSGVTHILIIKNILTEYSHVLSQVQGLQTEIKIFLESYKKLVTMTPSNFGFFKLTALNPQEFLHSKSFPRLLNLSRDILEKFDPRWRNYASNMGPSPFLPIVEDLLEKAGQPLPTSATAVMNV
nr:MAG: hypothetical protein [XiangYun mono-chu-like virus 7]